MNILERMAADTGLSVTYIKKLIVSASHRYKIYSVPKRTGGRRTIEHPSGELKLLQTWITETLSSHLPVSPAVYSYKRKVSIRNHANNHRKQNFLLRIDLKDFFPSITSSDIYNLLSDNKASLPFPLAPSERRIVAAIACRQGHLTIGAPSSPALSNAILYGFDRAISATCKESGITYTRYADDLFFSTSSPNLLSKQLKKVKQVLATLSYPKLKINPEKTTFTSRKRRRVVTGIVLTSDKRISIGRKKKRELKTLTYLFKEKQLDEKQISYLRGSLSYVFSVEPSFIATLEEKFGKATLHRLSKESLVNLKPKSRSAKGVK